MVYVKHAETLTSFIRRMHWLFVKFAERIDFYEDEIA